MHLPESRHVPLGVLAKAFPAAAHLPPDQLRMNIELATQAQRVALNLQSGAYQGQDRMVAAGLLDQARHRLNCQGIHCGT